MSRRPTGRVRRHVVSRRVAAVDLAAQIAALYTAADWTTPGILLARSEADFSLVSGAVATWIGRGSGGNAAQATATARPTYSASAINSRPGMTLDGGDWLITPDIDLSPATAAVLTVLASDADTAARIVAEWGTTGGASTAGGIALLNNDGGAGILAGYGRRDATASSARSAASYPLTTPAAVSVTWDLALASEETEIRHGGVNVTSTRPNTGNNTGTLGSAKLSIGARDTGIAGMTGAIGAVVFAAGTTAIPTSTVANVEALLATQWGLS